MYWLQTGLQQGQVGSVELDAKYYLDQHSDLERVFGDDYEAAFNHWLDYGIDEGLKANIDVVVDEPDIQAEGVAKSVNR
ncbi:MAG: hypothetical protein QM503_14015 [Bacteroidota bacterium]